jgi:hypothetical protein
MELDADSTRNFVFNVHVKILGLRSMA